MAAEISKCLFGIFLVIGRYISNILRHTLAVLCSYCYFFTLVFWGRRFISYYPIYRLFCPVLPMFLKRWCGQPINFLLFQDTNAALRLSALLDRLVIWRDLVGARVHCQRSWKRAWVISLLEKLFYSWAFLCLLVPRPHCSARPMLFRSRGLAFATEVNRSRDSRKTSYRD